MKKVLLIFLSVNFVLALFCQTKISGRVLYSEHREPVAAATVTVHSKGATNIIAYTMTDKDGYFTLSPKSLPDTITISVRSMNVESQSKTTRSDVDFIIGKMRFAVPNRIAPMGNYQYR